MLKVLKALSSGLIAITMLVLALANQPREELLENLGSYAPFEFWAWITAYRWWAVAVGALLIVLIWFGRPFASAVFGKGTASTAVGNKYPLEVSIPAAELQVRDDGTHLTTQYMALTNTSNSTVNGISVVMEGVQRSGERHVFRINTPLRTDRGDKFSLRPGEKTWATLATTDREFHLGPLADGRTLRGSSGVPGSDSYVAGSVVHVAVIAIDQPKHTETFRCDGRWIVRSPLKSPTTAT